MGQQGQIRGQVTDDALKGLLEQVSAASAASTASAAECCECCEVAARTVMVLLARCAALLRADRSF
jgi:hypothetical protein